MTLDEAVCKFESRFDVWHEIGDHAIAPTGQHYVEVCTGGRKEEGGRLPAVALTEPAAIRLWLDAANDFAKGLTGTIYWRSKPECDVHDYYKKEYFTSDLARDERELMFSRRFYVVYSRFLISDRPRIRSAILEKNAA